MVKTRSTGLIVDIIEFSHSNIKNYISRGNKKLEGILLYPTTKEDVDSNHTIGGHKFRLMTINLNQEWEKCRGGSNFYYYLNPPY